MNNFFKGLRVLDMSRILAGPWSAQFFGDLGANVIKVEKPTDGDDTRKWGPPYLKSKTGKDTESAYYLTANNNKRSIAINIKTAEGQELIKKIALQSDVLIENYKVGTLNKYGLGYKQLHALNPRLIYCSITGFGQTGPYANLGGYDYVIQGMSGLMSVTGQPDNTPGGGPMRVGIPIADLFAGSYAVIGILTALLQRNVTGLGQHLDISLLDTMIAQLSIPNLRYLLSGELPIRTGDQNPNVVPYQKFRAKDGFFVIAAGNDNQFKKLCSLVKRTDLATDGRFLSNSLRIKNREALSSYFSQLFSAETVNYWVTQCNNLGIPAGPVNDIAQILNDDHVKSRDLILDIINDDAIGGHVPRIANPIKFSDFKFSYEKSSPKLGEHTDSIMAEFGFEKECVLSLKQKGVIG